jgi:hypothetical protein
LKKNYLVAAFGNFGQSALTLETLKTLLHRNQIAGAFAYLGNDAAWNGYSSKSLIEVEHGTIVWANDQHSIAQTIAYPVKNMRS